MQNKSLSTVLTLLAMLLTGSGAYLYMDNRAIKTVATGRQVQPVTSLAPAAVESPRPQPEIQNVAAAEERLLLSEARLAEFRSAIAAPGIRAESDYELIKAQALIDLEQQRQDLMANSPLYNRLQQQISDSERDFSRRVMDRQQQRYESYFEVLQLSQDVRSEVQSLLTERDLRRSEVMDRILRGEVDPATGAPEFPVDREIFARFLSEQQMVAYDEHAERLMYQGLRDAAANMVNSTAGPMSDEARSLLTEGFAAMLEEDMRSAIAAGGGSSSTMQPTDELITLREWLAEQVSEEDMLGVDVFIENRMIGNDLRDAAADADN